MANRVEVEKPHRLTSAGGAQVGLGIARAAMEVLCTASSPNGAFTSYGVIT